MTSELFLSIKNNVSALCELMQEVNTFMESSALPARTVYLVNLALEEVLTNVLKYAFDDDREHEITVSVALRSSEIWIECQDDGKPFDPLAAPDPEMKDCISDCTEGGLGIHLVRKMVDSIAYQRDDCRNILTITVRSSAETQPSCTD
jgi:serine/threonine-protein kinase RsbW